MALVNIEAERERQQMTKEQLAQILGVSRRTLYGWCAEGRDVPSSQLVKMSHLFGCSIDYLLGLDEDRLPNRDKAS